MVECVCVRVCCPPWPLPTLEKRRKKISVRFYSLFHSDDVEKFIVILPFSSRRFLFIYSFNCKLLLPTMTAKEANKKTETRSHALIMSNVNFIIAMAFSVAPLAFSVHACVGHTKVRETRISHCECNNEYTATHSARSDCRRLYQLFIAVFIIVLQSRLAHRTNSVLGAFECDSLRFGVQTKWK